MPKTSNLALVDFPGWVGGLNRDADPYQLEVTESPDALNVNFGLRGSVTKRRGYTAWSETVLNDTPRRMVSWSSLGSTERMFYVAVDGSIFFGAAAPLTDSTYDIGTYAAASGYPVGIASLNNVLYFTALGTTSIYSYNGTAWTAVTATAFDGTPARFPKAAHIVTHHDRIFAGNVKSAAGVRYASRVHWSDALEPEIWTAANYIDFDPDDGQEITALGQLGESLIVFKNRSIQLLTGKSEESFARYKIESQIGTESPGSIVAYGGKMYFFDFRSGVWAFDGAGFAPIDEGMNKYILDGQNKSYPYVAHGYVYQGKYYLSVAWGATTYPSRTFVFDLQTEAITEYDYGVFASLLFGNVLYGGGPRDANGIYTLHNGLTDDGAAITSYFSTAWLVPEGAPFSKFRTRRVDTVWTGIGDLDVTLDMFRDFLEGSYVYRQTIDTNPGGALYGTAIYGTAIYGTSLAEVLSRTTGWGNARWHAVQFRASSSATTSDWELNKMALVVSSLSRVRGEA